MKNFLLVLALAFAGLAVTGCDSAGILGDDDDDDDDAAPVVDPALEGWCQVDEDDFSFFVTSMTGLWALSGDDINDWTGGFGGDFGGMSGADAICQKIGTATGHGTKTWHAFLSATDDGDGNPVHAIERIGEGPWVDSNGRLIASGVDGLLGQVRPDGDAQAVDDMVDECGVPLSILGDAHDVVTGSDEDGRLWSDDPEYTCFDWTSADGNVGGATGGGGPANSGVRCGHSFPRDTSGGPGGGGGPGGDDPDWGQHWLSDHGLFGCGRGANLEQSMTGNLIGSSGGYGQLYCFAL